MVSIEDFGSFETAWCPGCGNFKILEAVKKALVALGKQPHQVVLVSGIGQAAKLPQYLKANVFNGLHGRSLPPAQAIKMANQQATVIVHSGDGCSYGEGGNHFLAALRRNVDITLIAHDNQIYGLTKGQASPTTAEGQVTKAQPFGAPSAPFNPVATAVAMKAGFVARGFSGDVDHLAGLIQAAVEHKGFSLVDVLQPCVSFNKVNTYQWYNERVYKLDKRHKPANWDKAMVKAMEFGDKIPTGIIYQNDRGTFASHVPTITPEPLAKHAVNTEKLKQAISSFGAGGETMTRQR